MNINPNIISSYERVRLITQPKKIFVKFVVYNRCITGFGACRGRGVRQVSALCGSFHRGSMPFFTEVAEARSKANEWLRNAGSEELNLV